MRVIKNYVTKLTIDFDSISLWLELYIYTIFMYTVF